MLKLSLGHILESTHKCLNAERSMLLNVATEPFFPVYPTSHACVVLHFLIIRRGEIQDFKAKFCSLTVGSLLGVNISVSE